MAKGSKPSTKAVRKLLDEKRRIEQWLRRLDIAADKTPSDVRSKVASDYRKRLDTVLEELKQYREDLAAALTDQETERDALRKREQEAEERMAEAELRHTVGEYDESQWAKIRTELLEKLVKVREDLKAAEEELTALGEVVELMEVPAEPEPEEPEPALPDPEAAGGVSEGDEAGVQLESRKPAAKPGSKSEESQTDAFDELAFLRSVTEDDSHGPAVNRASGSTRLSTQDLVSPVTENEEEDLGVDDGPVQFLDSSGASEEDEPVGTSGSEETRTSGSDAERKTLKCAECGTMNLPTEWYCERCGAELAAL